MEWLKTTEKLPIIQENYWRSFNPVLAKTSKGVIFFAYFERIEDKEDGRYWGGDFAPKFVCEDKRSDFFSMIITDVVEWCELKIKEKNPSE
jgi:hypothetical protein